MTAPFSDNLFDRLYSDERFAELAAGLEEKHHYCFNFTPFGGDRMLSASLIRRLTGREMLVFRLDMRMVTGPWHFAQEFCRALVNGMPGPAQKAAMIKRLAVAGPVRVERDEQGEIILDVPSRADIPRFLAGLFDVPEVTGMEEDKHTVVMLSGFERMEKVLGAEMMETFYQKAARQAITAYVIFGHNVTAQAQKLEGRLTGALETVNAADFASCVNVEWYLEQEFQKEGMELTPEVTEKLKEAANRRVEHLLMFARVVMEAARYEGRLDGGVVDRALESVIDSAHFAYLALWGILNARQKSLLYGLSIEDTKSLYSEDFLTGYGFGTATNLQAALRGLNQKAIIIKEDKRWRFADPLFRLWIRRNAGL